MRCLRRQHTSCARIRQGSAPSGNARPCRQWRCRCQLLVMHSCHYFVFLFDATVKHRLLAMTTLADFVRRSLRRLAEEASQCADGRILEQFHDWHIASYHVAQPRLRLHDKQRMTAKVEEVIVQTDLLDMEQFAPDDSERFFQVAFWCDISHVQFRPITLG